MFTDTDNSKEKIDTGQCYGSNSYETRLTEIVNSFPFKINENQIFVKKHLNVNER